MQGGGRIFRCDLSEWRRTGVYGWVSDDMFENRPITAPDDLVRCAKNRALSSTLETLVELVSKVSPDTLQADDGLVVGAEGRVKGSSVEVGAAVLDLLA